MNKYVKIAAIALSAMLWFAPTTSAQTLLGGLEVSKKLPLGLSAGAEVEYRTMDWFSHTDQWSAAVNVGYKPIKWLKVGVQYKFIQAQTLAGVTGSGYTYDNYWNNKHRISISATGSVKLFGLATVSLRERWQYTYRPEFLVPRFIEDEGELTPWGNKTVDAKSKNVLRSRLQVSIKPYKKCRWTPFASYELYSLLGGKNHTEDTPIAGNFYHKYRVTAGTDFKINKKNELNLFYRYTGTPGVEDDDDTSIHHSIGVVYSFSF